MTNGSLPVNDCIIFIQTDASQLFHPTADGCSNDVVAASVKICNTNKEEGTLSHFTTRWSQTNWASTLDGKSPTNSLDPRLSLSLSPFLTPPRAFFRNVRVRACLLSLEGAPPLTTLSIRCLPIHYSYLAWPMINTLRGDYWHTQQEVSFKQASIKAARSPHTQIAPSVTKHNMRGDTLLHFGDLRGPALCSLHGNSAQC